MIPFFFRRYKKAFLATCISFLSSMCFIGAVFFSVGYFLNWEGVRDSDTSMGTSLLVAAACAVVGIILWKLAAWMAEQKYKKLAQKAAISKAAASAAASGSSSAPSAAPRTTAASGTSSGTSAGTRPPTSAGTPKRIGFCPKCGEKIEPGDVYCIQCGIKLPE